MKKTATFIILAMLVASLGLAPLAALAEDGAAPAAEGVGAEEEPASAEPAEAEDAASAEARVQVESGTISADDLMAGEGSQADPSEEAVPAEDAVLGEEILPMAEETVQATGLPSFFGNPVVVEDGIYQLSSALNAKLVLDVTSGSKANAARIQLYTANNTIAQRFRLTYDATTQAYTITSVNSGKVLDVKGGKKTNGGIVQQYTSNGTPAQQWRLYQAVDGNVYIVSALESSSGTPLVLDVPGGKAASAKKLQTYTANGTAAQRWTLKKISRTVADGTYELQSGVGGGKLVLDVSGASRSNGANVQIYTRNSTAAQWWRVRYDEKTGYYTIINCNAERSLDIKGGKNANKTNVQTYTANGSAAQRWSIVADARGGYTILSGSGGRALDVSGGKAAKGTNVQIYTANGSAAQSWTFVNPSFAEIAAGAYWITPMSNMGLGLDVVSGSTAEGANVRLWTINNTNAQKWHVGKADADGWRQITATHSGAYLGVNDAGNICMSNAYSTGDTQLWKIVPTSAGYNLVNKSVAGKVADIAGGKVAKSTNVRLYAVNGTPAQTFAFIKTSAVVKLGTGTPIMGSPEVTQLQAVRYLKNYFAARKLSLPSKWTKDGETIEKLVKYFWEEGAAEGVRGDVALAQSLHETGYFQFGNLVQPSQYNFAGLGATGPGHPGYTYKNARTGIRAQVQHLKAYASTEPLNQALIDQRFNLVSRGCAPTLGQLDGRWAVPGNGYGAMVVAILNAMLVA